MKAISCAVKGILSNHAHLFRVALALGSAAAVAAGCTGRIAPASTSMTTGEPTSGGSGSNGSSGGSGGSASTGSGSGSGGAQLPDGGTVAACTSVVPGRVTIHRLNDLEYNNTVRDLLGDKTQPASGFPPDTGGANFDNNADVLAMSPLLFGDLETAADALSQTAVAAGSASLASIVTCDPTKLGDSACATTVMTAFARKAWRRPPTGAEVARLIAFVPLARSYGDGFNQGIALAIKAVLLSPNFMFRPELDDSPIGSTPRVLNGYEIASRLSYFLWSSMPDATLAAAADANQLQDAASLQLQATRMLADPKASELVTNLAGEWFGTYKMATVSPLAQSFPTYDATLGQAMTQETTLFLNDFFFGTASFLDAIDAPYTYVNSELAKNYGLPAVTGTGFQKVSLAGTQRAGLLMQGSILTTTSFPTRSSPVRRGLWVLSNLLCTPPPSPPDNVPPLSATVVPPGSSQRTQLIDHIANPVCASCHTSMDPIGFGLEHFDGIGKWRDTDGTAAIDATGTLPSGQTFDGALQLVGVLKQQTTSISACVSQKFFSYSLGKDPIPTDQCQLNQLSTGFAAANFNIRSLIMQMISSDTFRMRQPAAPGGV
jgi:Protein of unknown function (DUF1592)/Protein of unknown function (DUF1588)/Protein of unknown function (DUF1595)/Protein of unknown function (DUF1587)/Protein of unknown function (DUF1585)